MLNYEKTFAKRTIARNCTLKVLNQRVPDCAPLDFWWCLYKYANSAVVYTFDGAVTIVHGDRDGLCRG